ncbi:MAG: ATP synthase subunit I [Acidiphilium sp.]|nr:ATP synthase subunit I [Acidiphilium sp.]MDD4934481.1 ATP synthase subunit I [Acidiphilium sp.]
MIPGGFGNLPEWRVALGLAGFLAAGVGLGVLYFNILWWSTRAFIPRGHIGTAIALTIVRVVLLAGSLVLAGLTGAGALLAMALGVLIGRAIVLRARRAVAS